MADEQLFFAQLTPIGRGAIATLLLSGGRAAEVADRFFQSATGTPVARAPLRRILFGTWQADAEFPGEELVICRTGDEEVEIHCHGGQAAIERIGQSLASVGCIRKAWQEVVPDMIDDPIAAAARCALAEARTDRCAAILLDQLHGALRVEVERIAESLASGNTSTATARLERLQQRSAYGKRLTMPFRVSLAGLPNVGKSSLLNALLGYTRAIVFDQPGTTRDVLTGATAFDGWPVELSDAAGVRETDDAIEVQGVDAARRRASDADLVVLVCDASVPISPDESALAAEFGNAIVAWNKCDLGIDPSRNAPHGLKISALTGEGLNDLIAAIVNRLIPHPPQPGDAVPFSPQQAEAIQSALDHLETGDVASANASMRRLIEQAPSPTRHGPL